MEGVCVTNCVFVNVVVILARAEATVILFNEEKGRHLWGIRGVNLASS